MSAPAARTASGSIPFTVPCVPIGMNAGVATGPCGVAISPQRAAPSIASRRNENGSGIGRIAYPTLPKIGSRIFLEDDLRSRPPLQPAFAPEPQERNDRGDQHQQQRIGIAE